MDKNNLAVKIQNNPPNLKGLIDQDILDRFKKSSIFWGDIINAQLIKTNKELIVELKKQRESTQNKNNKSGEYCICRTPSPDMIGLCLICNKTLKR